MLFFPAISFPLVRLTWAGNWQEPPDQLWPIATQFTGFPAVPENSKHFGCASSRGVWGGVCSAALPVLPVSCPRSSSEGFSTPLEFPVVFFLCFEFIIKLNLLT